jgi:hypothetical protein
VLPQRTARPSDDTFFDTVLRSVEAEAEEDTAGPKNNMSAATPDGEIQAVSPAADEATIEGSAFVPAATEPEADEPVQEVVQAATVARPPAVETVTKPSPAPGKRGGAEESVSFQEFEKRWTHFLSATLLKLCKEIHRNTIEKNQPSYDTTARALCESVGRSKRHTFLLLQQLETMGFVRRKEIKENNRLVGIRIWFHVVPLQK